MKYNNNNSNEKEYNKKGRGGKKKNPVMHNAIAHHPLTDAQLVPKLRSTPPSQLPPVYILEIWGSNPRPFCVISTTL